MTEPAAIADLTETTIKRYLCRHVHTSGRRCGSPALRGEQFCYYHHTTQRPGPRFRGVHPSCYDFDMPDLDDRHGVQFALAQVLSLIATNQIDPKRAGRLLYGLQIVSSNLPREPPPGTCQPRLQSIQQPPNQLRLRLGHGGRKPLGRRHHPRLRPRSHRPHRRTHRPQRRGRSTPQPLR